MGVSVGLFSKKPAKTGEVLLPGGWTVEVVGESHYQDALEAIAGGKTQHACRLEKWAHLVREPDNPYDRNAVAVHIDGVKVGHLAREDAASYSIIFDELLQRHGLRPVCLATIIGGWRRYSESGTIESEGSYGVELALIEPEGLLRRQSLTILEPQDLAAGPPLRQGSTSEPPPASVPSPEPAPAPVPSTEPPPASVPSPEPPPASVPSAVSQTSDGHAVTGPSVQPTWDASEGFEAKGVNGSVVVVREGAIIRRDGLAAKLSQGRNAGKQIPIESIAFADLKAPTALKNGHLYLGLHGLEIKTGFDAARDAHSVMFTKRQQPAFEKAKELIDEYAGNSSEPGVLPH